MQINKNRTGLNSQDVNEYSGNLIRMAFNATVRSCSGRTQKKEVLIGSPVTWSKKLVST
jgi:hypothetical protein